MNAAEIAERHVAARNILGRHGHCLNACDGPKAAQKSRLEFWSCPKGVVIAQFWADGGVTTFADWPLGHTWEDFEKSVTAKQP